ncbi:MAG: hypothetical protein IKD23_00830 [Lentisphaeria bacterium]|nr:hypothetical protein [Lentisphaeria bacterium]
MISWKICVRDSGGKTECITPEDMQSFHAGENGSGRWCGHRIYGEKFCVTTEIKPEKEQRLQGRIYISGFNSGKFITEIRFPVLTCPYDDKVKLMDGALDLGLLINDPWLLADGKDNEFYCSSTTLFALLYPDNTGIYLDSRSSEPDPRKVYLRPDREKHTAEFSMAFDTGNGERAFADWEMPGVCVFGNFTGSWFEAAQIYKEYALTRREFTARTKENPLRDLGMWLWNRGKIEDVIPPLLALQKELPGIPLALDWYWWHHNPYDTNYPNFWPPREGVENFRNAVAMLREKGIFVQVYLNGVCWDMDDPSFSGGGMKGAVIDINGEVKNNIFNRYTQHRLAWMCSCSKEFQDLISDQVKKLHDCGLSGQYLDMIGAFANVPCYSKDHGHLRGGGKFMAEGYRNLIIRLKEENPDYPFSSEGCTETFMDLLDAAIVVNTSSLEHFGGGNTVIPVFPAIYHGKNAMALFGNYALPDGIPPWDPLWPPEDRWQEEKAWHKLYPEHFYIDVIRNVVFGTQPMVCNLTGKIHTDPEYADIWRFIVETAKFYHAHIDFLFDGTMLDPAGFECGVSEVTFMQRMIFTKPDEFKTVTVEMPSLLHGIWQAPDGRKALFIGNYHAEEKSWEYRGRKGVVPGHSYSMIQL